MSTEINLDEGMDGVQEAIGQEMANLRHTNSPLAAIGEKLHRFNTGQWTDDDFTVIEDRSEIDRRLEANKDADWRTYDMGAILLFVEPMMPAYYMYKGVRIIGGNGWWSLEDGQRFKVLTEVFDYIDDE